jgi:hypothetical protein
MLVISATALVARLRVKANKPLTEWITTTPDAALKGATMTLTPTITTAIAHATIIRILRSTVLVHIAHMILRIWTWTIKTPTTASKVAWGTKAVAQLSTEVVTQSTHDRRPSSNFRVNVTHATDVAHTTHVRIAWALGRKTARRTNWTAAIDTWL